MATISDIQQWFANNPNATDAEITAVANAAGVTASQISAATGTPVSEVSARMAAAAPSTGSPTTGTPTASGSTSTGLVAAYPIDASQGSDAKTAPPTWTGIYNDWMEKEYLPWINSQQGTDVKISDLSKDASGAYVPNASMPLWNWNTGSDTAAQKNALDQRYIQALNSYNQQNNTNIQPDQSVLGANAQPNTTYRAADKSSGILGTGIGPNISFSDAAKIAALYYGGGAALDAFGAEAAGAETIGSSGTGLSVGAGNTGLGLTMPEATTGLGMTAPSGVSGLAAGSAAGTDLATAAGIGTGIGTLSPYATGTGSLLEGTSLAGLGAGAAAGALTGAGASSLGSGIAAGAGAASTLGTIGSALGIASGINALTGGAVTSALTGTDPAKTAQQAQQAADPFSPYRSQLANMYAGYLTGGNKTDITQMPGYSQYQTGVMDPALQAAQRTAAKGGQMYSGNEMLALQKTGQQGYYSFMTDYLNRLATASGASTSPVQAAQLGMTAASNQVNQQTAGLGLVGTSLAGLFGGSSTPTTTAATTAGNYNYLGDPSSYSVNANYGLL